MSSTRSLCEHIIALARRAGACAAAFAPADPLDSSETEPFEHWIAEGRHAGMDYMEKYAELRADPRTLLNGARSVLCTAFAYAPVKKRHPLFADYALGEDYHTALRTMLAPVAAAMESAVPGSATRICIDTAPLRERVMAVRAGLGFTGLNGLITVPGVGSGVFLAEILWTAPAEYADAQPQRQCEGCGACVAACPGGALDGRGGLDARRCLSYLTIEHRGELPEDLSLAGRRIYGCDVCRDVCPHNRAVEAAVPQPFEPSDELMALTTDDIANMADDTFRRIFRHSAVRRAKVAGLRRNAVRALKNGND